MRRGRKGGEEGGGGEGRGGGEEGGEEEGGEEVELHGRQTVCLLFQQLPPRKLFPPAR